MEVSVVIPVYNAEKYIEAAVRSALEQPETGEVIPIGDERVIGMQSLVAQQFSTNGDPLLGAWICDFRVLPKYRGMGVGTCLDRMRQEISASFSVTSSKVSRHIKKA